MIGSVGQLAETCRGPLRRGPVLNLYGLALVRVLADCLVDASWCVLWFRPQYPDRSFKRSNWNRYGQQESDCLIKTEETDGPCGR